MICWGVDVAVGHVAAAVVEDGCVVEHEHWRLDRLYKRGEFPDRVYELHGLVRRGMDSLADVRPPAFVLIEQPAGKFRPPTLFAAWGAVTVAAVRVAGRRGGVVGWSTPPAWRSLSGAGPNKASALVRAAEAGYAGDDEDVADAVCIGLAAERQITERTAV